MTAGIDRDAEGTGCLQRIDDVEVVRKTLGEILPRVGAGIGADETPLPIRTHPVLVMALQCCAVVLALVAERLAEAVEIIDVADQLVPDEMTGLVAEVAEQRPVGLVHRHARHFARHVVRLGRADGNQAVVVAGHGGHDEAGAVDLVLEEIEHQPALRIFAAIGMRQFETQKRIKQMALCLPYPAPAVDTLGCPGIRHQPVMAAGRAKALRIVRIDHPVAEIQGGIRAKAQRARRFRNDVPVRLLVGFQRVHLQPVWNETQAVAAADALAIVEMHRLSTGVAVKQSHGPGPFRRRS